MVNKYYIFVFCKHLQFSQKLIHSKTAFTIGNVFENLLKTNR